MLSCGDGIANCKTNRKLAEATTVLIAALIFLETKSLVNFYPSVFEVTCKQSNAHATEGLIG